MKSTAVKHIVVALSEVKMERFWASVDFMDVFANRAHPARGQINPLVPSFAVALHVAKPRSKARIDWMSVGTLFRDARIGLEIIVGVPSI